jgi:small subunit ribosomal protein S1
MPDNDDDFAAMLAEYEHDHQGARRRPKVGDLVRGRIISIGKEAVFVDLGGKAEGVLDRDQVVDKDGALGVAIGDELEARVVDDRGGSLVLKVRMSGRGAEARAELVQAAELGLPVEGTITEVVKGGLSVDIAGVRGFCPASQVDLRFVDDLAPLVGQRLSFRITQYQGGPRGNLVVSRRALLEAERAVRAAETRDKLVPGAIVKGTVTSFKPYGAFVDLGGVEGMLHVSELGFGRVGHPQEVLAVGQEVEVQVLKIEEVDDARRPGHKQSRVGLSLKALSEDPWRTATASLAEGSTVTGTITRLQPFGAFVEIAPGVEGLVHISELGAGRRINHPREVVKLGQAVEVTVLGVDPDKRRLSLSIAAGARAEEAAVAAEARAMIPQAPARLGTLGDLLAKARDKKQR